MDSPNDQRAQGLRALRHTLISLVPPLAVYYGMRGLGAAEIQALIAATVVSGGQVLVTVLRNRKLDVVSAFLVANFASGLVIAVLTDDAKMAQASNTVPGIVLGLFFVGSALIGTPLTEMMVNVFRPGRLVELRAEHGWTDADMRGYHRMHRYLSFWCGVLGLVFSAISLLIIFSFSVDVAQAVNQVFSLVSTGVLIAGVIVVVRRTLRRMPRRVPAAE